MTLGLTPYERDVVPFIRPFTRALIESVSLVGLERVLDHGAGTGEVSCALRSAGYTGQLLAVDTSETMVRRLRENLGDLDHRSRVHHGELSSYPELQACGPFDLIASQVVLPFVADPVAEV